MKRLILFLFRRRLGLKKYEPFQFNNQKSDAVYYFTEDGIMKIWKNVAEKSHVSVNWILDDECLVKACEGYEYYE